MYGFSGQLKFAVGVTVHMQWCALWSWTDNFSVFCDTLS